MKAPQHVGELTERQAVFCHHGDGCVGCKICRYGQVRWFLNRAFRHEKRVLLGAFADKGLQKLWLQGIGWGCIKTNCDFVLCVKDLLDHFNWRSKWVSNALIEITVQLNAPRLPIDPMDTQNSRGFPLRPPLHTFDVFQRNALHVCGEIQNVVAMRIHQQRASSLQLQQTLQTGGVLQHLSIFRLQPKFECAL